MVENKKWYKKWWMIVIYCFIGLMVVGAFFSNTKEKGSDAQIDTESEIEQQINKTSSTEKTWHKVFEINVTSGSKTTDTFTIKGEKFKVYFNGLVKSEKLSYSSASVYVYKQGDTAYTESSSADGCNEFSETTKSLCNNVQEFYVYENGEFYIKVNQANIEYWFISVYDYY